MEAISFPSGTVCPIIIPNIQNENTLKYMYFSWKIQYVLYIWNDCGLSPMENLEIVLQNKRE